MAAVLLTAPGGVRAERHEAVSDAEVRPRIWKGERSARSSGPAVEGARRFAADVIGIDATSFGRAVQHRLGAGELVLLNRNHRGLRVLDGHVAVRLDEEGRVRWATASAGRIPADLSTEPAISRDDLPALLGVVPHAAELVIDATGAAAPTLAYAVTLPYCRQEQTQWSLVVDATTGRVLRRANLIKEAGAYAFPRNPVTSSEALVRLPDLDTSGTISGHHAAATSCVSPCSSGDPSCRFCETEPRAFADDEGDFTRYRYAGVPDLSGAYAEIQAYYHVSETRNLAGWLLPSAPRPHLEIQVNVHREREICDRTETCEKVNCRSEIEPYLNAAAAKDTLVLGRGETVDYAYDGDVVSHEYGHAWLLTQGFLGAEVVDRYGSVQDGSALHEAYADLFAAFRQGSSRSGEYAAGERGHEAVRDLSTFRRCPEELYAPHVDSLIFSGAVWEVFRDISSTADRRTFAASVLAVPMTFGWSATFEHAARLTVAEVEASLGTSLASKLEDAFARRGLFTCGERLRFGAGPHRFSLSSGRFGGSLPASHQIRIEVQSPVEEILVMASGGFEDPCDLPALETLIRPGEPVDFTALRAVADAKADFHPTGDGRGLARLEGPWEPGTYHIALSNRGSPFEVEVEVIAGGGDCARCDGTGARDDQVGGCRTAPGSSQSTLWWAILLAALGLRRRRRSSAVGSSAAGRLNFEFLQRSGVRRHDLGCDGIELVHGAGQGAGRQHGLASAGCAGARGRGRRRRPRAGNP